MAHVIYKCDQSINHKPVFRTVKVKKLI